MVLEPAGIAWVSKYPTDRTTAGLRQPFRLHAQQFIEALETAGAHVSLTATKRPEQRAWLMHYAWRIAKGEDPKTVPERSDIPILWTRQGAIDMVGAYKLRYEPSLTSRHIEGRAVDMTIAWSKPLTVVDGHGKEVLLVVGDLDTLYEIGDSYGVIKLRKDPPHWSDDGR